MNEFFEFIQRGGILMVPIGAFSVVAVMVFLERVWALQRPRNIPRPFLALIRRKVREGRTREALTLCEGSGTPLSAVVAAGLRYAGRPREVIKEAFEEVGRLEVTHLGRYIEVLGTIAAVAPLLGLLGTVVGMIEVFRTVVAEVGLEASGPVNPGSLANGIWAALMTTAAGLAVAIPAFVGYKYLLSRVDRIALELEEVSLELLDLLSGLNGDVGPGDDASGEPRRNPVQNGKGAADGVAAPAGARAADADAEEDVGSGP